MILVEVDDRPIAHGRRTVRNMTLGDDDATAARNAENPVLLPVIDDLANLRVIIRRIVPSARRGLSILPDDLHSRRVAIDDPILETTRVSEPAASSSGTASRANPSPCADLLAW